MFIMIMIMIIIIIIVMNIIIMKRNTVVHLNIVMFPDVADSKWHYDASFNKP